METGTLEWIRLTESAWLIRGSEVSWGSHDVAELQTWPGVVDVVIGYDSIAVYFQRATTSAHALKNKVETYITTRAKGFSESRLHTIPVVYDGADLAAVAEACGLTEEQVVALHCGAVYEVVTLGFVPGFPFLRGLPEALHVPRRATPRTVVPAGAVGLAGAQTGVYPWATPGGWNLIGHTDVVLFDALRPEPSLLRAGDRVQFVPVTADGQARSRAHQPDLDGGDRA
jgi:KipI family sensor histidine kinase inhibitor